jgi:phenylacetate-CoA ligase
MQSQWCSRKDITALTQSRLNDLFQHASTIPLWQDIFRETGFDASTWNWEVFKKLPTTSRATFSELEPGYFTDTTYLSRSHTDHTSGSTGRPFEFSFDWGAELRSFAMCERMFRTAADGKRFPVVTMRARHKIGFAFRNVYFFYLRGYNSIKYRLEDLIALLKNFPQGVILYGFASSFIELARQASAAEYVLPIRAIISTGENIRQSERDMIERELHTTFHLTYATRELGWLAYECEQHTLHINEEWAYVEIVDDDGMPLPDGTEGRIVVTPFDNHVMPMIRYDSGDRGTIASTPCSCGRTLRTMRVLGRQIEIITFDDGQSVSLLDISVVFDAFSEAIRQYQIQQTGAYTFVIHVIPGPAFDEKNERLRAMLIRIIHQNAQLEWQLVDEIEQAASGKAVYFKRLF